jgi:hypothetical protein
MRQPVILDWMISKQIKDDSSAHIRKLLTSWSKATKTPRSATVHIIRVSGSPDR